jgi:GGDEF domain-containing protein
MVFSHDGLRDSLTRLSAPPYFYESLKREISISERSASALTVITFILKSDQPIYDYPIIEFSEIASRAVRLEDHVGRLGDTNFAALINGGVDVAKQITSRICALWTLEGVPRISLHYAWIAHEKGESALEFLNRLDKQETNTHSF